MGWLERSIRPSSSDLSGAQEHQTSAPGFGAFGSLQVAERARRLRSWLRANRPALALVAVLVIFMGLRLAYVRADPPHTLPNGENSYELFTEPIAKAHEARNRALFGAWQTNAADNYQYWRVQSPAWVYPLWIWFELMGVSYESLRSFSTLVATMGLAVLLAYAARRMSLAGTALAGLFVALNFYDILYQRSGLIETAVGAWMGLLVYCLYRARESGMWLLAAEWALVAGFLSKQTMVTATPMFLGFGLVAYVRWVRGSSAPRWQKLLPVAQGLAMVGALAIYCSRDDYLRTVVRNFTHVIRDQSLRQAERSAEALGDAVIKQVQGWDGWLDGYFAVAPVLSVLALGQVLRFLVGLVRRRPIDRGWTALVVAWLATAGTSLFTAQDEFRFRMLLLAPTALLASAILDDVARSLAKRTEEHRPRLTLAIFPAVALCGLAAAATFELPRYVSWVEQRDYTVHAVNQQMRKAIGRRKAVVVGAWAPMLVFDTPNQFYYVRSEFNSTRAQLTALGITHVLTMRRRDFTGVILNREFPELASRLKREASFKCRRRTIKLHSVRGGTLK